MSRQVVVLGMHRSYTSLLSGWLHINGVPMYDPTGPIPPHHEDPEIVDMHNAFLASNGMDWMNAHAPFTDHDHHFRDHAQQILQRRNSSYTTWGWKDPRTCVVYDFLWKPILPEAKLIIIYRDPAEVVESLFVRKILKRRHHLYVPDIIYGWHLRRHRAQYDLPYLICWNYYNQNLVRLAQAADPETVLVINAKELSAKEEALRQKLRTDWEIDFGTLPLSQLFQESTLERKPKPAIDVSSVVWQEAMQIYETLHSLRNI